MVETESTVTRTLEVLGTPSYMAPEQAVGNNAQVIGATDVYGLGAVLYQLLTGQPPFAGGTTYETIKLLRLKCLEKDPKRRYPSALALAEDLEGINDGSPSRPTVEASLSRRQKPVIPRLQPSLEIPYDNCLTPLLKLDPIWDSLPSDPAFPKLCEKKSREPRTKIKFTTDCTDNTDRKPLGSSGGCRTGRAQSGIQL